MKSRLDVVPATRVAGPAPRLSLERCRELVPDGELSDKELGIVRDALYNLALVIVDAVDGRRTNRGGETD